MIIITAIIMAASLCIFFRLLPERDTQNNTVRNIEPYKKQVIESIPHIEEIKEEVHIPTQDEIDLSMSEYVYDPLTPERGAMYYNDHKETYYSQNVLPGDSLYIPGRHVAFDGTVRDEDGYICVACDPGFLGYGGIIETSLGWGKVYDCGCEYGTVDLYVAW